MSIMCAKCDVQFDYRSFTEPLIGLTDVELFITAGTQQAVNLLANQW